MFIFLKLRKEDDEELILKGQINLAQKAKSSGNVANGMASGGNIANGMTTVTKTMTGSGGTGAGTSGGSITIERTQVSPIGVI